MAITTSVKTSPRSSRYGASATKLRPSSEACMSLLQRSKLGLLVAACGLAACNKSEDYSRPVDFAFNPDAKNFAILAGNDGGNLAGVPVDIQNWKKFVDQGIFGKFQIVYYEEK